MAHQESPSLRAFFCIQPGPGASGRELPVEGCEFGWKTVTFQAVFRQGLRLEGRNPAQERVAYFDGSFRFISLGR